MSLPADYRDWFVRNLHDALSGHTSNSVEEAVKYSEQSKIKCIGMTVQYIHRQTIMTSRSRRDPIGALRDIWARCCLTVAQE